MSEVSFLSLRGRKVRIDALERVCLNDIHTAGGFSIHQKPSDWGALASTQKLIIHTAQRMSGKSGHLSKDDMKSVYCVIKGRHGGSWAHPNLALAFASYLSPALQFEVNEVFLRYKAGDATLADDVLQRSTPEGNEWAAKRAMGRVVRNEYTRELDQRGVAIGWQFGTCTNETYTGLFDRTAKQMKVDRGISEKGNLRDKLSMKEIAFVAASEALAIERMQDEKANGFPDCRKATAKASGALRAAIDADRSDRKPRML